MGPKRLHFPGDRVPCVRSADRTLGDKGVACLFLSASDLLVGLYSVDPSSRPQRDKASLDLPSEAWRCLSPSGHCPC